MGFLKIVIYAMVFMGSALMVYNIYGFVRFALYVKKTEHWTTRTFLLFLPIVLLVMFLLGYLAVGIFGNPDVIVSGILFGGSIFVFVMYIFLIRITKGIVEGERLEAQLMAEKQSNASKTRFLASVSHEMRTPMNVIIGLDTVALTEPDLSPKTREHLEKIGLSARHLLGIINSVLDYNDIDSGTLTAKEEPFSLSDVVEQVNAVAQALCEAKGLDYVCDYSGADGYFAGDETLIKKVLIELIDNAVKYTDDKGSVEMTVKSRVENGGEVTFTVKDTGVGIDSQFLPKVFDVFAQEDQSSTSRHGGSGLGLAVVKKMVDIMGGTITVDSKKNVGSVFTVTIPVKVADMPAALGQAETEKESLINKRVLIVEDIPENAEIVADLLELEGATSEHAENGQVGVNMFAESPMGYYDAILMDLRMPVMDGLTAAREIRALNHPDAKTVPIIALTANAFENDIKLSLEAGMNAHIAKPADAELLYKTLITHMTRAKVGK